MGVDIIAEELSQLSEEQCYRTADLYFMRAKFGERPGWMDPLGRSGIELDPKVDYILGFGVVKRDKDKKETGIIDLRNVFSVSGADLEGLASILEGTPGASLTVKNGEKNEIRLALGKYFQVHEARGSMLDYDGIKDVDKSGDEEAIRKNKEAIRRFCNPQQSA